MDLKAESADKIDRILEGNFSEIQDIYMKVASENSNKYPNEFSLKRLKSTNKTSSVKMALSQMFLNSQGKNVSRLSDFLASLRVAKTCKRTEILIP